MKEMEIKTGYAGAGMRYPMQADGTMHVDNPDHVRTLRSYGAFTAAGRPAHASGFICGDCGFRGWFRECGRCGGENTRREGAR